MLGEVAPLVFWRSQMKVLHLPVKALYFRQMQTGEKKYEYRLQTDY